MLRLALALAPASWGHLGRLLIPGGWAPVTPLKPSVLSFMLLHQSWGLLEAHTGAALLPRSPPAHPVTCHTPMAHLLSASPAVLREQLSQVTVTLEWDKPLAKGDTHS